MRTLLIGRWQPPHLGHLKLVTDAAKGGEIILAIGSAQESNTPNNPFSAGERIEMWKRVLSKQGITPIFVTIPDANNNEIWTKWVGLMCPPFDRAITGDPLSYRLLSGAGYRTTEPEMLRREELNSTGIREMISKGNEGWKKLVPAEVVKYISEIKGVERLKEIARREN